MNGDTHSLCNVFTWTLAVKNDFHVYLPQMKCKMEKMDFKGFVILWVALSVTQL